jgi:AcrR family transcriptional regulator
MSVSSPVASVYPPRPLRADARRNHERLLRAAREAFDEHGTEACLDGIARRAGVGIGTLYRHFPTRRDMLEAVLHDGLTELTLLGERLMDSPAPGEALATWLRAVAAHAAASRGLTAELQSMQNESGCTPAASCESMQTMGTRLLARAQAADAVRGDIQPNDLFTLVNGIAWAMSQSPGDAARADRLLGLMLDGLSAIGYRLSAEELPSTPRLLDSSTPSPTAAPAR